MDVAMWGIHSERDAEFLRDNIIGMGWSEMGNLKEAGTTREEFKEKVRQVYPEAKKGAVRTWAGMLYRFVYEMKIGDYVVFPSKVDHMINIGCIESDYIYDGSHEGYHDIRKVKWLKHRPRRDFSQGALYEVGSAMTLFSIKKYAVEYVNALRDDFNSDDTEEDPTVKVTADEIMQSTKDFIQKELSKKYKGYDLEDYVADLLKSMGYRVELSPHGGDGGIDIIAYKDELPPRIAVQVKSQDSPVKEATIQSLKGAMMPGDYGLFVSLSGYTKNAKKYLMANPIIRGIDGDGLAELILKYYEGMSDEYKDQIPLKKVYIPVAKSDNIQEGEE